ncbi:MAG: RsmB/NOP family class I SAM-dependent RNA methyltransferase [Caulobacteraceae bacterium]
MTPAARLSAAIDILREIEERHRPVRLALKGWGQGARYAGSGDRAWVSGLVLDGLRKRRSLAWMMSNDSPRAVVLGVVRFLWGWTADEVAQAAALEPHGPGALTEAERAALDHPRPLDDAPAPVRGDYPDWLDPHFARVWGEGRAEHAAAQASRAPVDLRANALKATAEKVLNALESFGVANLQTLPMAMRIAAPEASKRAPPVETHPAFAKGWFEVQDLGSQLAAAAAGEIKGKQVLDLCAGGGGKTLALAAAMHNTGQLYAYDIDARRLSETVTRAQRAGVRNLQVRAPTDREPFKDFDGRFDVVFIDAPCTGTGTWRRHPDAKWRLTPDQLEMRMGEQAALLDQAAGFVKPGGRIVYVTCSVLAEENEDQVEAFLARTPGFKLAEDIRRLSPRTSDTDGFFIAVLERTG